MTPITDPTALADQAAAAAREAEHANHALAATGAAALTRLPAPTPWLAAQIDALHTAATAGTARGCTHLATGPRVAFAAAWAPNVVVCARCAPVLTPAPEEECVCDKCHTRAALIHPRAATIGPLIYAYGLCPDCAAGEPDGHALAGRIPRRVRR